VFVFRGYVSRVKQISQSAMLLHTVFGSFWDRKRNNFGRFSRWCFVFNCCSLERDVLKWKQRHQSNASDNKG